MKQLALLLLFIMSCTAIAATQAHKSVRCPSMESSEKATAPDCHHHASSEKKESKQESRDCEMTCCHLSIMMVTHSLLREIESTKLTVKFFWAEPDMRSARINIFRPPIS